MRDAEIKRQQAQELLREAQEEEVQEIAEAEKRAAQEAADAQKDAIERAGSAGSSSGTTSGVGIIDKLFGQ